LDEALVFLDRRGRYVTANTAALALIGVADRELARFSVSGTGAMGRPTLADWGVLTDHAPGIGESILVAPDGRRFDVSLVVSRIASGWRIAIEPLDGPAHEPGVIRMAPEVIAAWRGAERRVNGDGPNGATSQEINRLRRQYGQLTAQLREADGGLDDAPAAVTTQWSDGGSPARHHGSASAKS